MSSISCCGGSRLHVAMLLASWLRLAPSERAGSFVVCRREIGCRSSAKIFLREICLSCTGRDRTQIERKNFLRKMYPSCAGGESDADREQKNFST